MKMMWTQHQGHVPGRARHLVDGARALGSTARSAWREARVTHAFPGGGTTGVLSFTTDATVGNATISPAGAKGLMIECTARHLGPRST